MLAGLAAGGMLAWRTRRLGRVFGRPGGSIAYRTANAAVAVGATTVVGTMAWAILRGSDINASRTELPSGVTIGLVLLFAGAFVAGLTRPSKGRASRRRRRESERQSAVRSPNER